MANEFLTVKEIARQALPRLIENLVFPNLVHKDFSETFEVGKGATIQVRKPVILQAHEFDESKGVTAQDVKETSVEVTLDKLATVDAEFGAIARATSVDDLNRLFIEPAAAALAQKINADGLALYADVPNCVGTPGTTPTGLDAFANAGKALNDNLAPMDMRRGVWDAAALAAFQQVPAIVNAEKSGSTEALRRGSIGNIFGIENYMSQGVKKVAGGITDASAVKVNGAVTAGATELAIDGTKLVGALKKGDVLTIGGKGYIVAEDTAAAASNAIAAVKIVGTLPEIADNADVTVTSGGTQNLVFHEKAFAFVTRPLVAPAGVESYTTSYNGITLRVTRGYDMKTKKEMISMDVLYGYKAMYPELAVRVVG